MEAPRCDRFRRLGVALLACLVLITGGCGSRRSSDVATPTTTTGPEAPSETPAAGGGEDASTDTTVASEDPPADGSASPPPSAGASSNDGASEHEESDEAEQDSIPVEVSLSEPCVRPGESQTITVRTAPGSSILYHTTYSDGRTGLRPDYPGGSNRGEADADGVYEDTWVVKPGAPPGDAQIDVVAQSPEGGGVGQAQFTVAGPTGQCP